MNISALTLRDLEYLVAVANRKHFGKAAEACHVSQPALSAQIQKIESFLGITLFERTKRNVVVTPAGELVAGSYRARRSPENRHDCATDEPAAIRLAAAGSN